MLHNILIAAVAVLCCAIGIAPVYIESVKLQRSVLRADAARVRVTGKAE